MDCCLELERNGRKQFVISARKAYAGKTEASRKKSAMERVRLYRGSLEPSKRWTVVCVMHADIGNLEQEFQSLAKRWRNETGHYSLLHQKVLHPAYLEIIGRGEKVIPLIIREMERGQNHWFLALRSISRENPVPKRATFPQAVQSWVKWWNDKHSRYE